MAIQNLNLGVAPSGAGGDTFRSAAAKINENFANNTHAASRLVGTGTGNVMEVGAFGLGLLKNTAYISPTSDLSEFPNGMYGLEQGGHSGILVRQSAGTGATKLGILGFPADQATSAPFYYQIDLMNGKTLQSQQAYRHVFRTTKNTAVDANGFIKAASPIVQLFSDRIELNAEAREQDITFEKVNIGHYLIRGSMGFSKTGWWIEVPTDSNGNKICAVEYKTLDSGDLEIKTFKKKLNAEGNIEANLDEPIDIPLNSLGESRWIDIRLNEIKKPIVIKTPRTEKQPKLIQQIKYAPQLVYLMIAEDMIDDDGKLVVIRGETQKLQKPHIQTDANGTPILSNQPVIDENGQTVFEWVQAVDVEGNPIFEDVPVLDKDGNPVIDEVTHDPE